MEWSLRSAAEAKYYSEKTVEECEQSLVEEIDKFLKMCNLISKEIESGQYSSASKHCQRQLDWLNGKGYTYFNGAKTRFLMDSEGNPVCVIPAKYPRKLYKSPTLMELWNHFEVDELTGKGEKEMRVAFNDVSKLQSYNKWLEEHIVSLEKSSETVENQACKIRRARRLKKLGRADEISEKDKMLIIDKDKDQFEFGF